MPPVEFTFGPVSQSGLAAAGTEYLTPPTFAATGFDLGACIRRGGGGSVDALWMLLFALRAVYLQDDPMSTRVAAVLGAAAWRKIVSPNPLAPDIYVLSAVNGGTLYAIAGTTNLSQWAQYILQFDQVAPGAGVGRIFSTFNDVGNGIIGSIVADYNAHGGGGPVLMIGHSLGGALADYIGKRLWQFNGGITSGVVTYGAPRVGNEDYAAWPTPSDARKRPQFTRVFNNADFVPGVIPLRFVRAPDGDFTGLVKVIPCAYRHTMATTVRYSDTDAFAPKHGRGDEQENNNEAPVAVRYVASGGAAAPHKISRYAALAGTWSGRMHRELSPAVYGVYYALHNDLFAAGV